MKSNQLCFLLSHAFGVSTKSLSKPTSQSFSPIFSPVCSRDCCPSLTDMWCLENYYWLFLVEGLKPVHPTQLYWKENILFEITGITLILKPLF